MEKSKFFRGARGVVLSTRGGGGVGGVGGVGGGGVCVCVCVQNLGQNRSISSGF